MLTEMNKIDAFYTIDFTFSAKYEMSYQSQTIIHFAEAMSTMPSHFIQCQRIVETSMRYTAQLQYSCTNCGRRS